MRLVVSSQITIPTENFGTGDTFIRFHVRMRQEMCLQIGALVKSTGTNGTFMGGLFHVKDLVNCECPRLTESLATLGTFEWLLLAMDVPALFAKKNCLFQLQNNH